MGHTLHVSEEKYHVIEALAAQRSQTPEELLNDLVDEAWERACAQYDAAFEDDPDWVEGAREALTEIGAGQANTYHSTEAFFQHLGANDEDLERARAVDQQPCVTSLRPR